MDKDGWSQAKYSAVSNKNIKICRAFANKDSKLYSQKDIFGSVLDATNEERQAHFLIYSITEKFETMAPKLLSIRSRRWRSTAFGRAQTAASTEAKNFFISQEETASDSSSTSIHLEVNDLDDFALAMQDNPLKASEFAVINNVKHLSLHQRNAHGNDCDKTIRTLPETTWKQTTPESMIIMCGEDTMSDDDLSVSTFSSENTLPAYCNDSRIDPSNSPDFNAAIALQEQEIIRLALQISLYDV